VHRVPGSQVGIAASRASPATRTMRALRDARRPAGVAGGLLADLTRSRAERVDENALLRQQLIVASRAIKRPALRSPERASAASAWITSSSCPRRT
jgi:hypothetical protein